MLEYSCRLWTRLCIDLCHLLIYKLFIVRGVCAVFQKKSSWKNIPKPRCCVYATAWTIDPSELLISRGLYTESKNSRCLIGHKALYRFAAFTMLSMDWFRGYNTNFNIRPESWREYANRNRSWKQRNRLWHQSLPARVKKADGSFSFFKVCINHLKYYLMRESTLRGHVVIVLISSVKNIISSSPR